MARKKAKKKPRKPLAREIIQKQNELIDRWTKMGLQIAPEFQKLKQKDRKLIKQQQLSKYVYFIHPDTGVKTRGTKAIKLAKTVISQVSGEDIVIDNFITSMTEIFGTRNPALYHAIMNWHRMTLGKAGKHEYAVMLQQTAADGLWPSWEDVSDERRLVGKLSQMVDALGLTEGSRREIEDEFSLGEEWDVE